MMQIYQKAITRIKQATAETNSLIIEQKIEEKANYCVQFAYSESLGIRYSGAATQLTDKYGFITEMKILLMYQSAL